MGPILRSTDSTAQSRVRKKRHSHYWLVVALQLALTWSSYLCCAWIGSSITMAASWYLRPRTCFRFDRYNKQRCLEEAPNSSWRTGHGYTAHCTGLPFDGAFNSTPLGGRGALGDSARFLVGSRGLACTIINQAGPRVSLLQLPSVVTRAPPRWSLPSHLLIVLKFCCGPPVTCTTEAPSHLAQRLYEDYGLLA
jgi:hypothetical protein